jgi:type II secretory pathway pseudopilin PulG
VKRKKYMKKQIKFAGVTLLEILLVLAIASLIIIMSIRYYQTALNSNNSNVILEQVQNITAAADNLSVAGNTYSGVSTTSVSNIAGAANMVTPYKSNIIISAGAPSTYTVTIPGLPKEVCASLAAKLKPNTKYTGVICSAGTVTYTYNAQS